MICLEVAPNLQIYLLEISLPLLAQIIIYLTERGIHQMELLIPQLPYQVIKPIPTPEDDPILVSRINF